MSTARLRTLAAAAGVAVTLLAVPSATGAPAPAPAHSGVSARAHQLVWRDTVPQLRGAGHVGTMLTLTMAPPSGFHPSATQLTYVWLRHGDVIAGATSTRYRLTDADYGRKISVRITGHRRGWANGVIRSVTVKVAR